VSVEVDGQGEAQGAEFAGKILRHVKLVLMKRHGGLRSKVLSAHFALTRLVVLLVLVLDVGVQVVLVLEVTVAVRADVQIGKALLL